MNDQERITDLILMEKKMSSNPQLRSQFLDLLNQDHSIQEKLFQAAQSRGWYQTQPADGAQINQAYQKYSKMG